MAFILRKWGFGMAVTPVSLKFNFIASKMKLMNYLIYFEGDIILYYDI